MQRTAELLVGQLQLALRGDGLAVADLFVTTCIGDSSASSVSLVDRIFWQSCQN